MRNDQGSVSVKFEHMSSAMPGRCSTELRNHSWQAGQLCVHKKEMFLSYFVLLVIKKGRARPRLRAIANQTYPA